MLIAKCILSIKEIKTSRFLSFSSKAPKHMTTMFLGSVCADNVFLFREMDLA